MIVVIWSEDLFYYPPTLRDENCDIVCQRLANVAENNDMDHRSVCWYYREMTIRANDRFPSSDWS